MNEKERNDLCLRNAVRVKDIIAHLQKLPQEAVVLYYRCSDFAEMVLPRPELHYMGLGHECSIEHVMEKDRRVYVRHGSFCQGDSRMIDDAPRRVPKEGLCAYNQRLKTNKELKSLQFVEAVIFPGN